MASTVVAAPGDVVGAASITEPGVVMIAAVSDTVVVVTARNSASRYGTQGVTGPIAVAVLMAVAAIGDAVMGVAPAGGAVVKGTNGNLSGGTASAVAAMSVSMGQSGDCQQYRAQGARHTSCQKFLHSHRVNISFQLCQIQGTAKAVTKYL